jgi:hypothetical protein
LIVKRLGAFVSVWHFPENSEEKVKDRQSYDNLFKKWGGKSFYICNKAKSHKIY